MALNYLEVAILISHTQQVDTVITLTSVPVLQVVEQKLVRHKHVILNGEDTPAQYIGYRYNGLYSYMEQWNRKS